MKKFRKGLRAGSIYLVTIGIIFVTKVIYAEEINPLPAQTPVFQQAGYVWIEGEDSYTNFPFIDDNGLLHNGKAIFVDSQEVIENGYFAQFKFTLTRESEFYFWLAGNPMGGTIQSNNDQNIWYSPFRWSFNDGQFNDATVQNTSVGLTYAQGDYCWTKIGKVKLKEGENTLFVKIDKHRLRDENFTMYIDAVLLLPVDWHYSIDKPIQEMTSKEKVLYFLQYTQLQEVSIDGLIDKYNAISQNPQNLEERFSLAKELEAMGLLEEAIGQYEKIIDIDPVNKESLTKLAQFHGWRDEHEKVIFYYRKLVSLEPENIEMRIALSKELEVAGNLYEAVEEYKKILEIIPKDTQIMLKVAEVYNAIELPDDAISYYRKILALEPSNLEVRKLLTRNLEWMGRLDEAIAEYKNILGVEPSNKDILFKIADAYSVIGNFEEAILYYQKILVIDPNDISARRKLADHLKWSGKLGESIKQYESILGIEPDNTEILTEIARLYFWNNQPQQAISYYLKVIAAEPNNVEAHYTLGNIYESKGDFNKAVSSYRAALKLDPNYNQAQEAINKIKEQFSTQCRLGYIRFRDSAHIKKDTEFVKADWYAGYNNTLSLDYSYLDIEDDFVREHRNSIGFALTHKWNSSISTLTEVRLNLYEDDDLFCYRIGAEYTPVDNLFISFENYRSDVLDTAEAVENGISFYANELGLYYNITDKIGLYENFIYGDYSDGNKSYLLSDGLDYKILKEPGLLILGGGYEYRTFDEESSPSRIYWAPEDLGLMFLKVRWEQDIRTRTHYGIEYIISAEDAAQIYGHSLAAFLDFVINKTFSLRLNYNYYRSQEKFEADKTYYSRELGAALIGKF